MLKLVKKYFKLHIKELFLYAIIFVCSTCLGLITPIIQSNFFDELIYGGDFNIIIKTISVLVGIMLLTLFINFITNLILIRLKETISIHIKLDLVNYLQRCHLLRVEQYDSAYLTQQINNDCNNLMAVFLGNYASLFCSIISSIFILVFISNINMLFLCLFFLFIPIYALIYYIFKQKLYQYAFEKTEQQNKYFSIFNSQLKDIRQIKLDASFKKSENKLRQGFQEFYKKLINETILSLTYSGVEQLTSNAFQIMLFLFSAYLIFNKSISFGEITIILNYFQLLKGYITYFMNLGEYIQSAKVSADRILKLFNIQLEENGTNMITDLDSVELHNITFSYIAKDKTKVLDDLCPVFDNFNYRFEKGFIYSICGDNGIGKTTLINIILGLYQETYKGKVTFDNKNILQLDLYDIRQNSIAVVPQSIKFIADKVSDLFEISYNQFEIFVQSFGVVSLFTNDSFNILSLYKKRVTELSGGELQKVAICLALYKKPKLLILDEPTSSFDTKSIPYFEKLIQEIKKDMIIIMVTHDKKLQVNSDFIVHLSRMKGKCENE